MGQSGKKLTLNSNQPKYGTKQLVSSEQAKEVRRRKITVSFSYFKQIPNFELGGCSQGWHVGLIERLGVLGNMTPQGMKLALLIVETDVTLGTMSVYR